MRAKSHSRRDVHAHLIQDMARKTYRVIPFGNRRPHVEGGTRRLDVPAEAVQRIGHELVAARIDRAGGSRLLLPTVHRLDRGPLHGLEDARVDVRLELADEVDQVRAATYPTDPPARHVVRLRQGMKFKTDLFRALDLEKRQRPVSVERDLRIRRVVTQDDVVAPAELDRALEKRPVGRGGGWIVRI